MAQLSIWNAKTARYELETAADKAFRTLPDDRDQEPDEDEFKRDTLKGMSSRRLAEVFDSCFREAPAEPEYHRSPEGAEDD